ncbi:MAG: hypothetical protein GTN78_22135 [Gemmatimonadales bacterium]|nr:hypothetical protein [Gemmatimonadales bacterium]NIN10858.1 hypothetical protein [Gemmatimonadales bacterium]NIR02866.1 hypothetical protein [Gemmatimonadales bacterium]NIS66500.1 hypothetical protein [Gemmatimonadales bacterium]
MYHRDYILRMIEQVGAVLRRLREMILKQAGESTTVKQELNKAVQQVGFDLDLARIADGPTLERMVAPTGELEPGRGWLVAEALYLDGLEAHIEGRALEARRSLDKALRLYRLLEPDALLPTGFPEAADRIREIEDRLRELGE